MLWQGMYRYFRFSLRLVIGWVNSFTGPPEVGMRCLVKQDPDRWMIFHGCLLTLRLAHVSLKLNVVREKVCSFTRRHFQ
jgi:hypothetical protein